MSLQAFLGIVAVTASLDGVVPPDDFTLARVSWWSATCPTQSLQCAFLSLTAPFRDRRRVQPFATQQSASTVTVAPFVFREDPQLVLRRKPPSAGALRYLGFCWLVHRHSMPAGRLGCHHHAAASPHALQLANLGLQPGLTKGRHGGLLLGRKLRILCDSC